MSVEILEIRGNNGFKDLEAEWNALLSRSAHDVPFLSHEWISLWSDCFVKPAEERTTVIARENGRLLFGLPLIEANVGHRQFSLRVLKSCTNSQSFRFHFIAEQNRPDVIREVLQYFRNRKRWHMMLLSYVPLNDTYCELLVEQGAKIGLTVRVKPMFDSAVLRTRGSWEEFLDGLKKSFKKTMRRQDNRLQEIGGARLETLERESEVMEALPEALEIERRSWKGQVGSAIACQPTLVQFYTSLAGRAAKAGWMRLSFLNVGGTRTAFEFGFEYKRRFFSIKIGFDSQEYGSYSVGRRLVHESIRQCFNEGLKEYDFVGAYSSAQEHWNATTRPIGWIYVYNRRLLSKLHHSTEFQIKPLLKRAITPFRKMEPPAKA